MTDDWTPPLTRRLLERIAATLDVSPTYFLQADQPSDAAETPLVRQCEEVSALFRAIQSPARRDAVLKLLREMAREG
ncbi:hypothetical protein ACLBX9_15570 [Methylobacterium sp. A49B]|uniref:Uncharacterized protein n=1 Tax=Methylobacterium mesophilicum SR1.6/6 TaxID=908290 RepID=A0A6B9FMH1_9HYPH|nr:hypothetical protein [Methylobacterium mesophilicum]QGY02305.1 hypothetical protein MMSR116_10775 [Methylobacterium mesophilicum SR1.6/6]